MGLRADSVGSEARLESGEMRHLAPIRSMGGTLRRAIAGRFRPGIAVAVACVVALLAGRPLAKGQMARPPT